VAANVLTPLRVANISPENPLTGFEGPLHGGRKRGKGRNGGGK